jgi:tetratricopeptide (TPR) repeat protein
MTKLLSSYYIEIDSVSIKIPIINENKDYCILYDNIYSYINHDNIKYYKKKPNLIIMYMLGSYYQQSSSFKCIEYYKMAIKQKCHYSMNNLGYYYAKQKDYENMMKYYLMAIQHNNSMAMNNLGFYYGLQQDYDNMKKYYLMAICHNNSNAMSNLATYYKKQNDYDNMIKYYLMAINNGNLTAIHHLAKYYEQQKDYYTMIMYYEFGVKHNYQPSIIPLIQYYYYEKKDYKNVIKYIKMMDNILFINYIIILDIIQFCIIENNYYDIMYFCYIAVTRKINLIIPQILINLIKSNLDSINIFEIYICYYNSGLDEIKLNDMRLILNLNHNQIIDGMKNKKNQILDIMYFYLKCNDVNNIIFDYYFNMINSKMENITINKLSLFYE